MRAIISPRSRPSNRIGMRYTIQVQFRNDRFQSAAAFSLATSRRRPNMSDGVFITDNTGCPPGITYVQNVGCDDSTPARRQSLQYIAELPCFGDVRSSFGGSIRHEKRPSDIFGARNHRVSPGLWASGTHSLAARQALAYP